MIVEGQRVSYVGQDRWDLPLGSAGKVLSLSGLSAHVLWPHGVELIDVDDLVAYSAFAEPTQSQGSAEMSDWLDMPDLPRLAVRNVYDASGEPGLVTALDEVGQLAPLAEYVDEAISSLTSRLRADPSFSQVLAELEPEEADSLVSRVACLILGERVQSEED